jgi:hypothetical protein
VVRRELREGGGEKKEKRKKGKKGKRKKRERIPIIINDDLWVRCWVVCVALELDNPSNVEELPLILLACQGHGTSPIHFEAVRFIFLWLAFSCNPYWWLDYHGGKVVLGQERKLMSRQLEWCIEGMRQKVDRILLWSL